MSSLNQNEQIKAVLILAGFYFIQAISDLIARVGQVDIKFMISSSIWLTCFYWAPFLTFIHLTKRFEILNKAKPLIELVVLTCLLFIGIYCVSTMLNVLFMGFYISHYQKFISALLWGIFIYTLYRFWLLHKSFQQEKLLRKEAQLTALKNQLNPHFLFNSLNTISSLMHQTPDKADDVLLNLADILRYSLDSGELEKVKLSEELVIIRCYLDIEKARFEGNLIVNFDIEADCLNVKLPALLLQPLVENCIKHATATPIEINIKVWRDESSLNIQIKDNGKGFEHNVLKSSQLPGHGLRITQSRLKHMDNAQLQLSNNSGACINIKLEAIC